MGYLDEAVPHFEGYEGEILRFLWPHFDDHQKSLAGNQPDTWNMAVRGLEVASWAGLRVPEELVRKIEQDGIEYGEDDTEGFLALRAVRWQRELDKDKEPATA